MLNRLLPGFAVISMTIVVQAIFIGLAEAAMNRIGSQFACPPYNQKTYCR
jgi:hypothetical protein